MGIIDLLTASKQVKELTCAMIGQYAFLKLNDDKRQVVLDEIHVRLCQGMRITWDEANKKFNSSPGVVQAGFIADAMINLGIHHGVPGFQWYFIHNPFALAVYSQRAIHKAISNMVKYGIDPDEVFPDGGPREI